MITSSQNNYNLVFLSDGRIDDELAPFFVGIVNHDYRTVERRANVLMDAMKRIGSTLQKVSTKSFPRIRYVIS